MDIGGGYCTRGGCPGGLSSDTSTQARTVPGHTNTCQLNGRNMNSVGCGSVLTGRSSVGLIAPVHSSV